MLREGPLSFWNRQVVLYYSENSFLTLCPSAPFSYERCMTWRERESWRRGRLKPVHLILLKHRPPPLWEAYKHSDIHFMHTHTHTHNHARIRSQSSVCMVWNVPEFSQSPREKRKDFPRQMPSLFSLGKFCRLRGAGALWSGKRATPLFHRWHE